MIVRYFLFLLFFPIYLLSADWGLSEQPFSDLPDCTTGWAPASSLGYYDVYTDIVSYNLISPQSYQYGWQYLTSGVYQRRLHKEIFVADLRDANNNGNIEYRVVDYQQYVYCPPSPYCPDGTSYDLDTGECGISCPPGEHPSTDDTGLTICVCDNGFPKIENDNGELVCQTPQCPTEVPDNIGIPMLLFAEVSSAEDCPFTSTISAKSIVVEDKKCCYQKNDPAEDQCPINTIYVSGKCIPIESSNDDDNSSDHSCPFGEYWSFMENACVPFFPDDNETGADSPFNDPNSDGTNQDDPTDINTTYYDNTLDIEGFTNGYLDEVSSYIEDKVSPYLDSLKKEYSPVTAPTCGTCVNPTLFGYSFDFCAIFEKVFAVVRFFLVSYASFLAFRLIHEKL